MTSSKLKALRLISPDVQKSTRMCWMEDTCISVQTSTGFQSSKLNHRNHPAPSTSPYHVDYSSSEISKTESASPSCSLTIDKEMCGAKFEIKTSNKSDKALRKVESDKNRLKLRQMKPDLDSREYKEETDMLLRKPMEKKDREKRKMDLKKVDEFLRAQSKEDKLQMKKERQMEKAKQKERKENYRKGKKETTKTEGDISKMQGKQFDTGDEFSDLNKLHPRKKNELKKQEMQSKRREDQLIRKETTIQKSLREIEKRGERKERKTRKGEPYKQKNDTSDRWERRILKGILPKNFPSVRKAWGKSNDTSNPDKWEITCSPVEPLKVFEQPGFEDRLTATIETGIHVIIEKQNMLGQRKRFIKDRMKWKQMQAFGILIPAQDNHFTSEITELEVDVEIPQNVLSDSEKTELRQFLKTCKKRKISALKGWSVYWDYSLHCGLNGSRIPKMDIKSAIEGTKLSVREYAERTAAKMMSGLDEATAV